MKTKLPCLILLLSSFVSYSQTFEWLRTPPIVFNMNPDGISYPTTSDPSGNVYFTGFKDGAVPYTDIFGNLYYNKYDTDGTLLFSNTFSGSGNVYDIASDSEGNIIMALGYLNSITMGDIGLITINQNVQYVLVKFDPDGNVLWYEQLEIADSVVENFRAITVDADDNIYIGYDNYFYSYITKMSPEGVADFTITQQYVNRVTSVSVDNAGNIYAAGSCANINSNFAGVDAPTDLPYSLYLVKYSPAGVYQWLKYVEDITCPAPIVKAHTPDEVYFSSHLFDAFAFDGIASEGPVGAGNDFFVAKLNATGAYQWVREVPGAGSATPGIRNYLNLDSEGNIYFAGNTSGTINWGNNIATSVSGFSNNDLLVLKYNPAGEIQMAKIAGGVSEDRVDAINVDADGGIFISGMVHGEAAFDTIISEGPENEYYPYLAKINTESLGVENPEQATITIYPNPVKNILHINTASIIENIAVIDMNGKKFQLPSTGNQLDTSALSNGIYILEINTDLGTTRIKIIK